MELYDFWHGEYIPEQHLYLATKWFANYTPEGETPIILMNDAIREGLLNTKVKNTMKEGRSNRLNNGIKKRILIKECFILRASNPYSYFKTLNKSH
jgi:hypothetical protein